MTDASGTDHFEGNDFEDNWESVGRHEVPEWYHDAKLDIFLHWGLYSVPGWAPQVPDIQEMLRTKGPRAMLRDNPYAEVAGTGHADLRGHRGAVHPT